MRSWGIIICVLIFGFYGVSWAQDQNEGDVSYEQTDSVVRYDILEMAKNMMSCAAYANVFETEYQSAGFVEEVKWMFMVDAAQTEEETGGWVASAQDIYNEYWEEMQADEAYESAQTIETQRRECYNLGVARKLIK